MVNSMVERATSDMLIGPDWAVNLEICDVLNRDPAQAKDVVKGIKKRIGSRNPKVQLLALTLLETIIKNCGDIIHMHVAEKDLLRDMVKIVRKKPDFHVKEKILILIDTWQEAFGGPRARYPQFYAAYQELLRAGAVFPQRMESAAPVFTPPQTHPLTSYPQNIRTSENRQDEPESSAEPEFSPLSFSELKNARRIMDVLAEMLNAIDPGNKEGLRQEVIVDLVTQCRNFKQRVVHLVNSTSDESLLCEGLALNDDLQRLLAKHEAIASGKTVEPEKTKPEPVQGSVDPPLIDAGAKKQLDKGSTSNTGSGLQLVPTAPASNGTATMMTKFDRQMDLLSGDDFNSPVADNTLAIVPVGQPMPASPVANDQNTLALIDMFSESNNNQHVSPIERSNPATPPYQQQQNFQTQQSAYLNGTGPRKQGPQFEQSLYTQGANSTWNGQMPPQPQLQPPFGAQSNGSFPAPPWEAQPVVDNTYPNGNQYNQPTQVSPVFLAHSQPTVNGVPLVQYPMGNDQVVGMYVQPITARHLAAMSNQMGTYPQQMQSGQMAFMYPQQMYGNNQMGVYGNAHGYGNGYGNGQNAQYIDQQMSALSVRANGGVKISAYQSSTPSGKASKPEDKLFGDLVDISKFKPTKTGPAIGGSM